jgi:hypothetical protein
VERLTGQKAGVPAIAGRASRAFDHLANGVLIYVLFSAMVWALATKGPMVVGLALPELVLPAVVAEAVLPFLAAAVAALAALAGLRWGLKRMRLRLSREEQPASAAFLGVVMAFAVGGAALDWHAGEGLPLATEAAVVVGAWAGVMLRRRIRI